jgi:hypothetical protein
MKRLLLLAFLAAPLFAQPFSPPYLPDCYLQVGSTQNPVTAPGLSASYDNRSNNCVDWIVVYNSTGFSAVSVELDSAPDNSGVAGTFVAFAGTLLSGANPSSVLNQAQIYLTGYFPWLRLNFASKTGTGSVQINAYGYRKLQSGLSAACPNPCPVVGLTNVGLPPASPPVLIAEDDGSGNVIIPTLGTKSVAINLSGATGENQIIALSGSTIVRIAHISVSMSAASTVSIDVGTGSNCAGGTATIWGPYPSNTTSFSLDLEPSMLKGPAGDAICLNFGGTVTAGGGVTFAQY